MASIFSSRTSYWPIFHLLNTDDPSERDELAERWKENKLKELNFIGIVGALLAGVLTSTGSWPDLIEDGKTKAWNVRAAFYCGILLALAAVLIAAQQSILLHRLCSYPDRYEQLRRLLRSRRVDRAGRTLPRSLQMYVWQLGDLFLTASAVTMLTGMMLLMWHSMAYGEERWDGEAKLAVTFTVLLVVVAGMFAAGQYTLYAWEDGEDKEEDESRVPLLGGRP